MDKILEDEICKLRKSGVIASNFELSKPCVNELKDLVLDATQGAIMGQIVSGATNPNQITNDVYAQIMPLILGFCRGIQLMNKLDSLR